MTMPTPSIEASGAPPVRLAMCQVRTERFDIEGNTERTLAALREAANRGAQIAITPECVLQGYPPMATQDDRTRFRAMAEPLEGNRIQSIRAIAREHSMWIVAGFVEAAADERLHNSSILISDTGEVVSVYRKVHCRPFENIHQDGLFTPGESFTAPSCTIGTVSHRIGMYICFDREIPESTRALRALGAELIACPLATNTASLNEPSEKANNELLTRARAAENELFIAVVNHAGIYNGGSFLVGPSGECLHQMGAEEGVAVLDVPLGAARRNFHSNPWGWAGWGFRRPEVYDKYLTRNAKGVSDHE